MDLIVINGRVETMNANNSVVQAVGIRNGRIAVLGTNNDVIAERHGGTTVSRRQGQGGAARFYRTA